MSAQPAPPKRLSRLSKDEVSALQERHATTERERDEARRIIADAEAEAASIRARAQEEWSAHEARLKGMSDDVLQRVMDRHRLTEGARALAELIVASQRVQLDFDRLTPWLVELVCDATYQIIGDLDPKESWVALLTNALRTARTRWDVKIECNPQDRRALQAAIAELETVGTSSLSVEINGDLDPDTCLLKTPNGAFDISVATQLSALRAALTEAARAERARTEGGDPALPPTAADAQPAPASGAAQS